MPTTISDAAKQSGVSAKMIRYYESIKLLPTVDRTEGNYRTYTESEIHALRFIRRARDLGYSIADIERLLSLWRGKDRPSADVKRIALNHAASLRYKIAEMEVMLRAVEHSLIIAAAISGQTAQSWTIWPGVHTISAGPGFPCPTLRTRQELASKRSTRMIPPWLTIVSILSLIAAFASAALIIIDLRKRPQSMAVMNPVWPITALYFGPIGLWAYYALGRAAKPESAEMSGHNGHHHHDGSDQPFWVSTFIGSTHCGAGCTLGDIIAEFMVFFTGAAFVGSTFGTELVLDYVFAFTLGVAFQYFSIAPMRGLGLKDGIIAAVKADFLSLTAFEVGLFGWMALMRFVFFGPHLHPDSPVYWFMMQIGMIIGFVTTYPMNWFLVRAGIKEAM